MLESTESLPKLKTTNVSQVLALMRKISREPNLSGYIGGPLESYELQSFVNTVHELLPEGINRYALFESSTYLGAVDITPEELTNFAWRLAGNIKTLMAGRPVRPWSRQPTMEWMPMQVVACEPARNRKNEICGDYTMRVLAGTASGMLVKRKMSRRMCMHFAKELGFPRRTSKKKGSVHKFQEFQDLVNLRLYGLFDPNLSATKPSFWYMACPSSMKAYNRDLLKKRARINFDCPYGYTHPCNKCAVGYKDCPAATHANTYLKQHCNSCDKQSWFDTKQSAGMCLECLFKVLTKREE